MLSMLLCAEAMAQTDEQQIVVLKEAEQPQQAVLLNEVEQIAQFIVQEESEQPQYPQLGALPLEPLTEGAIFPVMGQAAETEELSPKDNLVQYGKDFSKFKAEIERNAWHKVTADTRTFVAFARNYANRIHCDGVITDIVYPKDKGLELKILNNGHDAFLRVGNSVPQAYSYFPVDLNIICMGQVYQLNGVVDSKYPAMNIDLVQSEESIRQEILKEHGELIRKASGLPHEEKITKIMQRVFQDDFMTFWSKRSSLDRYEQDGFVFYLRQKVTTHIDDIVAWDFAVEDPEASIAELITILRPAMRGELISIGRVRYSNGQRVIILSVM